MNYATIKNCDIANGPGVRVSLFVSGCTHHCPECFNAVAWDFAYGEPFTPAVEEELIKMLSPGYIRGLTLLGGEPFEPQNQAGLVDFVERVRATYPDKTIWAYSGYCFETDLLAGKLGDPAITRRLLACLDVLVDGEFKKDLKNPRLYYRGSTNQRIINVQESLHSGVTVLNEYNTERVEH